MKKIVKILSLVLVLVLVIGAFSTTVMAAESEDTKSEEVTVMSAEAAEASVKTTKALSASIAIAVVAGIGALAMAFSIIKTVESISRQPEAAGDIRSSMMLGLVFIETAIIYALIVAILIVFVL